MRDSIWHNAMARRRTGPGRTQVGQRMARPEVRRGHNSGDVAREASKLPEGIVSDLRSENETVCTCIDQIKYWLRR